VIYVRGPQLVSGLKKVAKMLSNLGIVADASKLNGWPYVNLVLFGTHVLIKDVTNCCKSPPLSSI